MMDQNFEIRILWFLKNLLKFSKRRRAVPLRPIWTIMVAAKLDHSRSLWPSFIKIGQRWRVEVPVRHTHTHTHTHTHAHRQTDRQTNSAENKGPSGLQSGQQMKDRRSRYREHLNQQSTQFHSRLNAFTIEASTGTTYQATHSRYHKNTIRKLLMRINTRIVVE